MLRGIVIVLGLASLIGGLVALETKAFPPAAIFAVWGAILVLGTVFERVIYKPVQPTRPGAGWQRTSERFIDDSTGKPVTVYIEPVSGERAYVQE